MIAFVLLSEVALKCLFDNLLQLVVLGNKMDGHPSLNGWASILQRMRNHHLTDAHRIGKRCATDREKDAHQKKFLPHHLII